MFGASLPELTDCWGPDTDPAVAFQNLLSLTRQHPCRM